MREFIFAGVSFESQVHPSRLKIFAVRNAGNFEVTPLPWRPDFDVIRFRAGKARVPGAKQHHTIVQAKDLQYSLGMSEHFFVLGVSLLWLDDFNQLDFIKLMNPDHAPSAQAGRPGFSAKTRRV